MLTDIEIAQAAQPLDISAVAEKAGVASEYLECYGRTKAKVDYNLLRDKDYQPGQAHSGHGDQSHASWRR